MEKTQFKANLGTGRVALLVIACAAPLGSVIGNTPIGFTLGNGAGLPIIFLVAGLVLAYRSGTIAITAAAGYFAEVIAAGHEPC